MEFRHLLLETGRDHVGVITINRPESMNTFNSGTAEELSLALKTMDQDPEVRVVLIKGAGKAFCAGIDINEFNGKTGHEFKQWVEKMENPLCVMAAMNKPVMTQVHGVAAANGAGLVSASDLCISADSARFGFTAVKVGLFCLGPAVPLVRAVGRKKALEMLMYGDLITADTALEIGLINRAVPLSQLEEEAREWAAELARRSPTAVQIGKKAFYGMADMEYTKAFDYMNEAFARLCTTEDATEGVSAFLEKRAPQWKGR
ncbi:enoyl-CoA hydratase-related protein [Dethiosulfatarculus sandiegensis]|uniref:Enoyl-CoA hydratase domain-containing protein 3, mitochondrial n=1 Tax=Dethiosulfatarculus sandiegensis TaxID=1429043 RepID=A0A0D2HM21_9BACT|nr:enoyl-CoA hydratase-related protein [Dethiosulfatarculus sandiegensis]KIX11648.1 enoyl-CoA hydratase [Dethiosulfatarculus sandiegensis]